MNILNRELCVRRRVDLRFKRVSDLPIICDADTEGFAVEPVTGNQTPSEVVVSIRFRKCIGCHLAKAVKTPGPNDHQAAGPQNEARRNVPG
jgi:hypothetical protein